MKLRELTEGLRCTITGNPELECERLEYDSRRVQNGCVFVAVPGTRTDGTDFIEDAIERGAIAIVAQKGVSIPQDVTQVIVEDARKALSLMASRLNGTPSEKLTMIALTGTNGKTTVSHILEAIFKEAGIECGIVGTTGYRWKNRTMRAELTTPDPLTLQTILRDMHTDGVTHCVMEVSSHALAQKRTLGCRFKIMAFTNLSQDHLDYHRTMEEYFRAKRELFVNRDYHRDDSTAVLNMDDRWGRRLLEDVKSVVTYSVSSEDADVYPVEYTLERTGIKALVKSPAGDIHIVSSLVGEHNLYNILTALSVATVAGIAPSVMERAVAMLEGVPGRLEPVSTLNDIHAYVDYAHTPDALERVCRVLREFTEGRLITVFGCGGNRDRGKRPLMGRVAEEYSDVVIVTSDNPRDEEPLKIIRDIVEGMEILERFSPSDEPPQRGYTVVPDRKDAIELAVRVARRGDTILVAGKGHEDYQIIGARKLHFDDREVLREAIAERTSTHAG